MVVISARCDNAQAGGGLIWDAVSEGIVGMTKLSFYSLELSLRWGFGAFGPRK